MTKKINLDLLLALSRCVVGSRVNRIDNRVVDAGRGSIRKQMMKKHRDSTTSDEVWKLQCSNNGYHFIE